MKARQQLYYPHCYINIIGRRMPIFRLVSSAAPRLLVNALFLYQATTIGSIALNL